MKKRKQSVTPRSQIRQRKFYRLTSADSMQMLGGAQSGQPSQQPAQPQQSQSAPLDDENLPF